MSAIFTALSSMVIAGRQLYTEMEASRLGNIIRPTKLPKLDTLIANINEPVSTSELAHKIKTLATDDTVIANPSCVYMKNLVNLLAYHADVVLDPSILDNPSEENKKRKAELDEEFDNLYKTYGTYSAFKFAMKGFTTILAEVREQTAVEKRLAEEIKRLRNELDQKEKEIERQKFIEQGFLAKNHSLEKQILVLTLETDSLKGQIESKNEDIEAMNGEIGSSAHANADLKEQSDNLQAKIIELQNQVLASTSAQQRQVQAITKAFNETQELVIALAAAKTVIDSSEKARAHLVVEHAESKLALNKKLTELKSNFDAVTLKLSQLNDVQSNFDATLVKLISTQDEVVQIRREMVAALAQAGQDQAAAEMKIADLTTQMDHQKEKHKTEYETLRETGSKLMKTLKATVEELKQKISKQAQALTEFEIQVKGLVGDVEKAVGERDHQANEAASMAKLASQLGQQISELKEEIIGLRTQKEEKPNDKKIKVVALSTSKGTMFAGSSKPATIVANTSPTLRPQPGKSA